MLAMLIFVLARSTGDPLNMFMPIDSSEEVRAAVRRSLGLDQPVIQQFATYILNLFRGEFGVSIKYRVPAADLFWQRLPNTLVLMVPAFILTKVLGIIAGVIAASWRGHWIAGVLGFAAVLGLAVPAFWIAVMLMLVFAVNLGWLPAARMGGPEHYVLPLIAITIPGVAETMRLTRSSMLEQLRMEYIKLARVKGVSENKIIWRHALKNSLTAVIAASGTTFALLLTGSILIENVFAWPGTGRLLWEGIQNRDFPVVQALIILQGLFLVLINLAADLLHAYIDPRVRLR